MNIKRKELPLLIFSLVLPQAAGLLGSLFTFSAITTWYQTLIKPPIAPPNWVFGPVWTTLFLLMGISYFLIARKKKTKETNEALLYFYKQLALNVLWSVAFFGLHSPLGGIVVIIPLWYLILVTIKKFSKISPIAGQLMWPYLAWVTFATILNICFFLLNR